MNNILEKIISDFRLFIENLQDKKKSKLVSFLFYAEFLPGQIEIDQLTEISDEVFLFRTPNNRLNLVGLNSALTFATDNQKKYSSHYREYEFCKNKFINNWSEQQTKIPIIFSYAKFDPTSSSSLWNEFDPIKIYIPEFIFTFQNEIVKVYFNFIFDETITIEYLSSRLSSFLLKLCELSSKSDILNKKKILVKAVSDADEFSYWNTISLRAIEELQRGDINKLVLSRTLKFESDGLIHWHRLLTKLYERFPDCYLFFIKKNNSIFFGSSPEMFLKVSGKTAEVESVAGSAARGEKSGSDYELEKILKTSEKNLQEHIFVSDFITSILSEFSNDVRLVEEKQIRKLDNIQHLLTKFRAELNSDKNIFELIDSLFPTPAVCGVPKEKAINLIRKLETHDRGLYSGLVGLFDFEGNCELAVSIRSALYKDEQITAFAGAGIIKDSDPQQEFIETNLKLNTILALFDEENKS